MKTLKQARSSNIEASFWLEGFRGNDKAVITEDSRFFPKFNRTLSLLWIHKEI